MFSWKRWMAIGVGAIIAIIAINCLGHYLNYSPLTDYWYTYTWVILIVYAIGCMRSFYYYKRSQWEMYPEIKQRALDAAEEKKGIITFGDFGKVPSQWRNWLMGKFKEEDLAIPNPRNEEKILFPEVIAETHTPDEVVELGLPTDLGSEIMRLSENKQESESEGSS